MEVYSSFLLPKGLLAQTSEKDLEKCLGAPYKTVTRYRRSRLVKLVENHGEIDAFVLTDLKRQGATVCQISINLIHNSFSRRSWCEPSKDLYKGNGRVKHESHIIQQGPFQSIYVHSYQMKDIHDKNNHEDYELGGNNHFDIHIFRNTGIVGGSAAHQRITINEILEKRYREEPGLVIEQIKEGVVREFLEAVKGRIKRRELTSSIEDHDFAAHIMSAVYVSHVRRTQNSSAVVSFPIRR